MREEKRLRTQNLYDPDFWGENPPDFLTPTRVKLYTRMYQDMRNTNRISRKPIPKKLKKELVQKAKEYADFKAYERFHLEKEQEKIR